jgi:citrate lyase subunit beta/citryl-CoA lyase
MSSPGSNERFLAKAPTVPADMSFLDLEDSVAPLEKEAARAKVADAIKNLPWDDRVLCVRINAWDTEWTYGDVIEVVSNAGERLDELMLPKVQTAAEVVALDLLLTQVEKKSGLPVGPHWDRGPDRDHRRADQRGGDLRRVAPARDHHLRARPTSRRRWRCRS